MIFPNGAKPVNVSNTNRPKRFSELPAIEQTGRFLTTISDGGKNHFEVRILDCVNGWRSTTESGYFADPRVAAEQTIAIDNSCTPSGCYVTINPVNPALIGRANQRFISQPKCTTSDPEIIRRTALMIDIDPVRLRGISSTREERDAARRTAEEVRCYLRNERGWPEPLTVAMSGNGYQLLYAIDLANDGDAERLIKQVLEVMSGRFSNEIVVIDKTVTNAARLCKIPGTTARKGDNTPERPHRKAVLLRLAPKREIVTVEMLQAVAGASSSSDRKPDECQPKTPRQSAARSAAPSSGIPRLVLERYFGHYGVQYKPVEGVDSKERRRLALIPCPFHGDHGGRDTVVFESPDGILGFKCLHHRCAGKTWRDVRAKIGQPLPEHFEPPLHRDVFANYTWQRIDDKSGGRRAPLTSPQIAEQLFALTAGFPKRVGRDLFVLGRDGCPVFIDGQKLAPTLFAWVEQFVPASWQNGPDFVPKDQFLAYLQMNAKEYDAVELFPHFPQLPQTYYAHPDLPDGDGSTLQGLLDQLCPLTDHDRELARALLLSMIWGGPPGKRPAFIIAGPPHDPHDMGRGSGKSSFAQNLSELVGGYISFSTADSHDSITTRLFSAEARFRRVAVIDNVKTARLSSAELEALITSSTISGRRHYVGEGRRPNTLLWLITMNGGRLSKDLAQRCMMIRLARPTHRPSWDRDITQFIAENRWKILADALAALKS